MEFSLGVLRWSEPVFWATSLRAYDRAVAGYMKSKGIGTSKPMTRSRLKEMIDLDAKGLLARYGTASDVPTQH